MGGEKLKAKYGKPIEKTPCAKSWELSFHKGGLIRLMDGKTLAESITEQDLGKNVKDFPFFCASTPVGRIYDGSFEKDMGRSLTGERLEEENKYYIISANYTDSEKLFGGMLSLRNAIKTVILLAGLGYIEVTLFQYIGHVFRFLKRKRELYFKKD